MTNETETGFDEAALLAEHQAEKAKREAAEEATKQAEREARQTAERNALIATRRPHMEAVATIINARGSVPASVQEGYSLFVDGIDLSSRIDFKEEYTANAGRWNYKANGKLRIVCGYHGNKQQFPQRKDGTYNYEGIADWATFEARSQNSKNAARAAVAANETAAKAFREKNLINEYYGVMSVTASTSADKPLQVKLDLKQAMTENQAEALLLALWHMGLIKRGEG